MEDWKQRELKWDLRFLEMAKLVGSWSKDPSTKVGAVIVRPDNTVCSIGYNGFPSLMDDNEEFYSNREEKYSRIVHAEINAQIFSRDFSLKGYTLYTWPLPPCDRCCVQMIQAGIQRIVAPKITDPEIARRWQSLIDKTRRYCEETKYVFFEEIECKN